MSRVCGYCCYIARQVLRDVRVLAESLFECRVGLLCPWLMASDCGWSALLSLQLKGTD